MDHGRISNSIAESREIERLHEELRREHHAHLRTLADFDNFRRRTERERAAASKSGKREILHSLLEEIDSFERAMQHLQNAPPALAEGIIGIHRNLLNLLESNDVVTFQATGERFDPEIHEALGTVSSSGHEPGTVVEEVQRGYRWGDEILRPARVRIAR